MGAQVSRISQEMPRLLVWLEKCCCHREILSLTSSKYWLQRYAWLPKYVCLIRRRKVKMTNLWVTEQKFYKIWSVLSSWTVTLSNEDARYPPKSSHSLMEWLIAFLCTLFMREGVSDRQNAQWAWVYTSAMIGACFGNHFHLWLQNT